MKTTRLFLLVALVCFALLGGLLYLLLRARSRAEARDARRL